MPRITIHNLTSEGTVLATYNRAIARHNYNRDGAIWLTGRNQNRIQDWTVSLTTAEALELARMLHLVAADTINGGFTDD